MGPPESLWEPESPRCSTALLSAELLAAADDSEATVGTVDAVAAGAVAGDSTDG